MALFDAVLENTISEIMIAIIFMVFPAIWSCIKKINNSDDEKYLFIFTLIMGIFNFLLALINLTQHKWLRFISFIASIIQFFFVYLIFMKARKEVGKLNQAQKLMARILVKKLNSDEMSLLTAKLDSIDPEAWWKQKQENK